MKVGVKSRADNVSLWQWICERKTREIRCVSCAAFDPTFISILVFLLPYFLSVCVRTVYSKIFDLD